MQEEQFLKELQCEWVSMLNVKHLWTEVLALICVEKKLKDYEELQKVGTCSIITDRI